MIQSPNYTKGRGNNKIELVIIHIMAGSLLGTDSWFSNPISKVSAHYGFGKNKEIHQYVDEKDTAWHAGNFEINQKSIGIEHEGQDLNEWNNGNLLEWAASETKKICDRWGIPIDREHIKGHYEISSKKPNCPAVNKDILDKYVALMQSSDIENKISILKQLVSLYQKLLELLKRS